MKLTDSKYKNIIGEYFDYSMNWDFLDIVANVLERVDLEAEEVEESIYEAIDEELIYYDDQWTIMRFYQLPKDANLENALMEFQDDITSLVNKIKEVE